MRVLKLAPGDIPVMDTLIAHRNTAISRVLKDEEIPVDDYMALDAGFADIMEGDGEEDASDPYILPNLRPNY